jgi:hypothetical protein
MYQEEVIEILEEIARNPESYPSARISAIRALLELEKHRATRDGAGPPLRGA